MVSAQHYDSQVARERMSRGRCPECGGEVDDHGGLGGPGCSLTDNGVFQRIEQYRREEAETSRPEGVKADADYQEHLGGGRWRVFEGHPAYFQTRHEPHTHRYEHWQMGEVWNGAVECDGVPFEFAKREEATGG
jgi:hypothetical protein